MADNSTLPAKVSAVDDDKHLGGEKESHQLELMSTESLNHTGESWQGGRRLDMPIFNEVN